MTEIISLHIKFTSNPAFVTEIELTLEGQPKLFLLDTGAATSSLALDMQTKSFPIVETSESKGASGIATSSHLVQIKELKLGRQVFPNDRIKRVDRDILGLDFLGQFVFQIDFKSKKMCILEKMPDKFSQKLRKLLTGHIVMPVELKNKSTGALFDTGADSTVIDFEFVKNNSDLFKWIRKENGTDVHGHVIESEIYSCNEFQIGSLKLQNVEMATFNFGNYMRDKMEGTPIILGNNVIAKAKWNISLKTESWMLEPYEY